MARLLAVPQWSPPLLGATRGALEPVVAQQGHLSPVNGDRVLAFAVGVLVHPQNSGDGPGSVLDYFHDHGHVPVSRRVATRPHADDVARRDRVLEGARPLACPGGVNVIAVLVV